MAPSGPTAPAVASSPTQDGGSLSPPRLARSAGIIGTAMWLDHLMADEGKAAFEDRMQQAIPLGRTQSEQDIGEAVRYLATAENVTGVSLSVSGGLAMN